MIPPMPSTSMVAPIKSGATSCTLSAKKARFSALPSRGVEGFETGAIRGENRQRTEQDIAHICHGHTNLNDFNDFPQFFESFPLIKREVVVCINYNRKVFPNSVDCT